MLLPAFFARFAFSYTGTEYRAYDREDEEKTMYYTIVGSKEISKCKLIDDVWVEQGVVLNVKRMIIAEEIFRYHMFRRFLAQADETVNTPKTVK